MKNGIRSYVFDLMLNHRTVTNVSNRDTTPSSPNKMFGCVGGARDNPCTYAEPIQPKTKPRALKPVWPVTSTRRPRQKSAVIVRRATAPLRGQVAQQSKLVQGIDTLPETVMLVGNQLTCFS